MGKEMIQIRMIKNEDGTLNDTAWEVKLNKNLSILVQLLNDRSIAFYHMDEKTFGEVEEENAVLDEQYGFVIPQVKRHFTFFRMEVGEA